MVSSFLESCLGRYQVFYLVFIGSRRQLRSFIFLRPPTTDDDSVRFRCTGQRAGRDIVRRSQRSQVEGFYLGVFGGVYGISSDEARSRPSGGR